MYKIIPLEQGSPEWREFRKDKIGGSDIPVIMGVSKYRKLNDYIQEKITGVGENHSEFTKKLFADGHEWEITVRDRINTSGDYHFKPIVLQSAMNDKFFVSLDGFDDEHKSVLEVKSTTSEEILRQVQSGVCPVDYFMQIQWQLFITGFDEAVLATVNRANGELLLMNVERDPDCIRMIETKALSVLERINTSVQPYVKLEIAEVETISIRKKSIRELQNRIKDIEAEIQKQGEALLIAHNAQKIEGCGVRIQWVEPKGAVSWKKIPEVQSLDEAYLDKFRAKRSKYVKISDMSEKGNDE